MKKLLIVLFCIVSFISCEKDNSSINSGKELVFSETPPLKSSGYTIVSKIVNGNQLFIAKYLDSSPAPLVIAIHGGAFIGGDPTLMFPAKINKNYKFVDFAQLYANHISYASIGYKLIDNDKVNYVHESLEDIKGMVQHIIDNAEEYNIDPERIILFGSSAGASASLWLGLEGYFKKYIKGIVTMAPQASLNPVTWKHDFFDPLNKGDLYDTLYKQFNDSMDISALKYCLFKSVDDDVIINYSKEHHLNYLNFMDEDDPEIYLLSGGLDLLHNYVHVFAIYAYSVIKGHTSVINYAKLPDTTYFGPETIANFCIRKFSEN